MIEEPKVLPECEADTTLVDFLLDTKTNHHRSITKVANRFSKANHGELLIGVVDDDKKIPAYFRDFTVFKQEQALTLKQKPETRQYLITLAPEVEGWLIGCANQVPDLKAKYQKFTDPKKLQRLTKSQAIQNDPEFKNFLNMLWQKEVRPFITLEQWLKELLDRPE